MTAALSNWSGIGPGSSDADLAIAAADGDRRAFAEIYDRYADKLHDFCIGMLRDRDSAADCVQDGFCIVATSLGGLREPDKLRPWLYSIVRNEAHKRLRELKRERPSDEVPDVVSQDASPDTLAHRLELANLINEAAGGLSDRDQAVLELAYRQGLDGPELAMALGVTQTNANTMVGRLRDTIERSLGALLVARRIQADPSRCPEMASVLHGWDGKFTILMRKRIARHIESCAACDDLRGRSVNRQALLGAAPLLIPAPGWLKNSVMRDFELTSASHGMGNNVNAAATQMNPRVEQSHFNAASSAARPVVQPPPQPYHQEPAPLVAAPVDEDKRRVVPIMAFLIGIPLLILGGTLAWVYMPGTALSPSGVVQPAPVPTQTASVPLPSPAAVKPAPQPPNAIPAPRPGAPLPTPQGKPIPTPQAKPLPTPQAPIPTALAPIPTPVAPPPIPAPAPLPEPIPQPPLGSIPLPQIPFPQYPGSIPAIQPQVPAQAPGQAPAQSSQPDPAAQLPKTDPGAAQDPGGQAPKQAPPPAPAPEPQPIPVGPAPKKVDTAPPPVDCNVDVCVK